MKAKQLARVAFLALTVIPMVATAQDPPEFGSWGTSKSKRVRDRRPRQNGYAEAIVRTADMVGDPEANSLARRYGLDILNITWEDTGRYKNSAVGPNISDMTIQVDMPPTGSVYRNEPTQGRLMPVFRFPNFSDVTGDMDPQDMTVLVGNEKGRGLRRVSLDEYLENLDRYLTGYDGGRRGTNLLADRDDRVLVSAQACFLPVPQQGKVTFTPVIFNYQSSPRNPAVLAIVATRQGTSATVVENGGRRTGSWGQRLFYNNRGQMARFTGEREQDYIDSGAYRWEDPQSVANRAGLNMVMLIQVPLVHRDDHRVMPMASEGAMGGGGATYKSKSPSTAKASSDVENAVIGHGRDEGPFTELNHLDVRRDTRFPVRVTVQFYKATSNGVVNDADVRQIKSDIDRVYRAAENVGSLVTDGRTGRPTEYDGMKVQPRGWWDNFWRRYEGSHHEGRDEAVSRLARLLGERYYDKPVSTLYLRDLLRQR